MSTTGSSTSAPNPQDGTNSNSSMARPTRGRGTRGGRGRGTSGRGKQPAQPTAFQMRAAEVASSNAAPVQALPVSAIPLSSLSAQMDSVFPVSMDPVQYVSDVLLDTNGYVDLCSTVYHNISVQKEEFQKLLSQDEFLLCCGWLHAYRVIMVRNTVLPITLTGYLELEQSMKALPPIPEPLAHYLEGIGLYRDAYGNTLCPNIALPARRDNLEGVIPTLLSEGLNTDHPELYNSMFPYGMYERRILAQTDDSWQPFLRIARDDAVQTDERADNFDRRSLLPFIDRTHYMPFPFVTIPPHERRRPNMPTESSSEGLTLLRVLRWQRSLFVDFLSFCQRAQKVISCVPFPVSTAGSAAMTTAATPPDSTTVRPDRFRFFSYMALNDSERHAARLFRYRSRLIARDQNATNDADFDKSYNVAPHQLRGIPPLELTELRTIRMYLQYYVSLFIKT